MDDQYKALHQQAVNLQYKFHDFSAGYDHPQVNILKREVQQLVDDVGAKKNPHTIEDRIKVIQNQLVQAEHAGTPIMHYEHKDFLHDNYEHMRQTLHTFDHY